MKNYSQIDNENKQHLINLINWFLEEVLSAGGDGDGIWYSKYYSIDDLEKLILENISLIHWTFEKKGDSIYIWNSQEYLIITNDKEKFDNRPSWQQVSLDY